MDGDMKLTAEARQALLRGELIGEAVVIDGTLADNIVKEDWVPQPATGTFPVERIEVLRRSPDVFTIVFYLPSGLALAVAERIVKTGDTLRIDDFDMQVKVTLA
jgi:hypothetical protein